MTRRRLHSRRPTPGSTPAQATPEPTAPAAPQELLAAGLTPDALESASFNGALSFKAQGQKNTVKTSGAFEIGGPKEMPKVDVQVSVDVPGFERQRRLRDHRLSCLVHAR